MGTEEKPGKGGDRRPPAQGRTPRAPRSWKSKYKKYGRPRRLNDHSQKESCLTTKPGRLYSVQSLSRVRLFSTPWTAARQASLSVTNSRSLLKLMSIESVMPSSHLILCRPFVLPPSIFPSIRVFSNGSVLCIRQAKDWS